MCGERLSMNIIAEDKRNRGRLTRTWMSKMKVNLHELNLHLIYLFRVVTSLYLLESGSRGTFLAALFEYELPPCFSPQTLSIVFLRGDTWVGW